MHCLASTNPIIRTSFDFVVVLEFDDKNSEQLDFVAPEPDSAKNVYFDLSAAQSDVDNQDSEFVITESDDENNKDLPTAPELDAEVDTENNDLDNAAPESNENKNFEFAAPESEDEENNVNFVTRDADKDDFEAPKLTDKSNTNLDFVAAQSDMTLHENNNDIDFAVSESDEYNHDYKAEGKNVLYDVPAKNGMIIWIFYHLIFNIFYHLITPKLLRYIFPGSPFMLYFYYTMHIVPCHES